MNSDDISYASRAAEAQRKRAAAKKLIEQYYFQLTEGCGNPQCNNEHCASNPFIQKFKPNQAAALALHLFKEKAHLCVARNTNGTVLSEPGYLDSAASCIQSVSSTVQESTKGIDNTSSSEEISCMDTSGYNTPCDISDPDTGGCSLTFPAASGIDSAPQFDISASPSGTLENSDASIPMVVGDTLSSSKLSHSVCPAKIISGSSSTRLADMPISEESNCMDVSDDALKNGDGEVKSDFLHGSDFVVPCNIAESISSEPSSSFANPTTISESLGKEKSEDIDYLDEDLMLSVLADCKKEGKYSLLIRTLGKVFSGVDSLQKSFLKELSTKDLCKEDIRAMEVDEDKDKDSKEVEESSSTESSVPKNYDMTVDIDSLRRSFTALFRLPENEFQGQLITALILLSQNLEFDLKYGSKNLQDSNILNVFVIVMEIPMLEYPEYMEKAFPGLCKAATLLPAPAQAKLARVWCTYTPTRLKELIDTVHQFITLKVITGQFSRDFCINDDETVVAATKLMKILCYANMIGGVMECESQVVVEESEPQAEEPAADDNFQDLLQGAIGSDSKEPKEVKEDLLGQELGIKPIDCRCPMLSFEEFYNEPLSDQIEMDRDFACYKTDGGKFSFMNYAFILTPAVKALGLYYDNRIRMYSERRISVLHSLVHGAPPNPYLKLRVRRDHLIDDALVGLEMVAMENPNNLKKQLVVEFEGEQGIDEGGVSKEFFQLVVEEVFNPDFAMFTLNPETQTYWFNPTSFESDAQFTLIGIILGLAIYNNIILDVHFPMVLYRKLMGKRGTFYDLQEWNPILSKGLQDLLSYEGDDIETVFVQTFRITYQDVFGTVLAHDLKENGDTILVNQSNKKEFVELYASFLLNKAVEKQFRAFRRGFHMVTDDSPLKLLFRPEEIELLVCGSKIFDFNALEETTDYDGGYLADTPIIKWFWELVHEFSLDQKRKLLQFATGSDRVPVGGLSKLKLVIARHGPDSERLPTAHTCFNVLLLPEYSSKEKLEERLLKAINYSKGFGML